MAKASNHTFEYVRNDMGWRTMWRIYDSVQRRRAMLQRAAEDNPMASLALMMSYLG